MLIKAKLVMDKQAVEQSYESLRQEHTTVEGELRALRETFNLRQDTWIKEKLNMQERVKEMEDRQTRGGGDVWAAERDRLKEIIDDKVQQLERMKRDEEVHRGHMDTLRREVRFPLVHLPLVERV